MGSWASYYIGRFSFISTKWGFSDSIFNVFNVKTALKVCEEGEGEDAITLAQLITTAGEARKRYALKCHVSLAALERCYVQSINESYEIEQICDETNKTINELLEGAFSFNNYLCAVGEGLALCASMPAYETSMSFDADTQLRRERFGAYSKRSALHRLLCSRFLEEDGGGDDFLLLSEGLCEDIALQLILFAASDDLIIKYNLTDIIGDGLPFEDLCRLDKYDTSSKVMVVTEGTTDSVFLEPMLCYLSPEYADCFAFLSLENLDSGVSYLVKYFKLFAKANLRKNMLFIFDNDLEGNAAMNSLPEKADSFLKKICLPSHQTFSNYPCLDFNGNIVSGDINGTAVSIELLFPDDCLKVGGVLSPIRWTNYDQKAKKYQGSVLDKSCIQKQIRAFIKKPTLSKDDEGFGRLRLLIANMVEAFQSEWTKTKA